MTFKLGDEVRRINKDHGESLNQGETGIITGFDDGNCSNWPVIDNQDSASCSHDPINLALVKRGNGKIVKSKLQKLLDKVLEKKHCVIDVESMFIGVCTPNFEIFGAIDSECADYFGVEVGDYCVFKQGDPSIFEGVYLGDISYLDFDEYEDYAPTGGLIVLKQGKEYAFLKRSQLELMWKVKK